MTIIREGEPPPLIIEYLIYARYTRAQTVQNSIELENVDLIFPPSVPRRLSTFETHSPVFRPSSSSVLLLSRQIVVTSTLGNLFSSVFFSFFFFTMFDYVKYILAFFGKTFLSPENVHYVS